LEMEELPELASTRALSTYLVLVVIGARGAHYYRDFVGAALGHFYGQFRQLPLWPRLFVGAAGYRAAPTNLFFKNPKSRLENSKKIDPRRPHWAATRSRRPKLLVATLFRTHDLSLTRSL
jgi:hypothetical protein